MNCGLVLAAALLVPAVTVHAQVREAAPAVGPAVFRQLAEAKTSDAIWERSFGALIDRAKIAFLEDPRFAQTEARCPGFVDAVFLASGPVMRERHFADRQLLRDGMTRIFAQGMTEAQAAEALAFYRSDEGRFLLELGADSNSYEEKFAAAMSNGDTGFDREAFERDLDRTHDAILRNADPELVRRVTRQLLASRWYPAYLALHARIQDLRFAISKAPSRDPGHAARLDQAVKRGGIQHLVNCGKAVPVRTP